MSQLNSLYLHQPPLANDCRPAFKTNWPTRSFIAILLLGAMVTVGESSAQTQFWITDANAVTTVISAIITWKSVVLADSQVEYGRTALYGSVSTLAPTRVSAHAMTLSGLIAGTTYHYRLRSRDLGGVAVIGNDHTFTTVTATKVTPITVSVSPQSATVVASATQQFSATVANATNKAVSWSATTGTVNSSGLFTASAVTVSTAATVTATSAADPTKSAKASVTLQPRAAIVVSISPASATLPSAAVQQFTASVSNTSKPQVTWSSTAGSITSAGLYTAPTVSSTTTATITAASQADTTKKAFAALPITASPAHHSVALSWVASPASDLVTYRMYRSTTNSTAYGLLASAVSGTAYSDQTVQSGTVYYYAVTTVNSAGQESAYSNQIKVTIP
jgi:hypothetical protein